MVRHRIVALDSWVKPQPMNFEYDVTIHDKTTPDALPERMKDATIVTTSGTKVTRAGIEAAPNLKLIAINGTGSDHVDKVAAQERGVAVCHVPAQNTESVSEHAFALYYGLRRRLLPMHELTVGGDTWSNSPLHTKLGPPPRTNTEETLVVVGYGALGKKVEQIGKALGMEVLIAERKGAQVVRAGRTPFQEAIGRGTVFILVAPLDDGTFRMIGAAEFAAMQSTAFVINVGRGATVEERALAQALKDGQIGGAATDVYEHEPATKDSCPLLDPSIPNLILSPHIAWYSSKTIKGTLATVKTNLEAFAAGKPVNVVVSGSKL
ncbi:hypothetical protein EJ03DRAFT_329305 [Teratosphaeria nubilosa]|uniref:Glycerate dehydrogenase n=1 Tax=Teratosphaeria nubilosa TaxID=161662 RepID=A0A6G1L3U5_9PEZI|nr:hypothetical protein EJ03DRAFT_329305 [Teratosphaeria nubilosa]